MFIKHIPLHFFACFATCFSLHAMDQQPLRETERTSRERWYEEYVPWIQQKLTDHMLSSVPPVLVSFYEFLNKPFPVGDDKPISVPVDSLAANSTAFHACTLENPYLGYHSLIQRELVSQLLFDRIGLPSQELTAFLCCLKIVHPKLYVNGDKVVLPHKGNHCSVRMLLHLLTSDKKHVADAGRKILKQRSVQLQQILQEKDSNGETALAKESARKALSQDYSSKTLLNPALYDLHFKPFVAALRTKTLQYLPDNNVFKIAYTQARGSGYIEHP